MRAKKTILSVFFLTGACGLVYEVLWVRMLGLVFGNTTYAVSTVLAAFMGGLALGSYLFGRVADRSVGTGRQAQGRLLRLYAGMELGVGAYALLTPLLFQLIEHTFVTFYRFISTSGTLNTLLCVLLSFAVILVPTTLMGGTLPVLTKLFAAEPAAGRTVRDRLGWNVGMLYSLNTWGAVFGAFLAGYLLIGIFGVRGTLLLTAALNLAIAGLIYSLAPSVPAQRASAPPPLREKRRWPDLLILMAIGLSGCTAFLYEVAWTRTLSMIIGSSIYAFSTMLSVFLAGIALGSFLYAKFSTGRRARKREIVGFGLIEAGIALSALLLLPFFNAAPSLFLKLFELYGKDFLGYQLIQFPICFVAMLIPTTLFGASLPLACRIYGGPSVEEKAVGRAVGDVYAANTVGSIVGSLAAGFALIPLLGLQNTIHAAASINLGLAVVLLYLGWKERLWARGAALASLLLFVAIYFSAAPELKRSELLRGVYHNPRLLLRHRVYRDWSEPKLLFYGEGLHASVAVVEQKRGSSVSKRLMINARDVAGASRGTGLPNLKLMEHLPMLLHPAPSDAAKEVLVVGIGAGISTGAISLYRVKRIDQLEFEPEVIKAVPFFKKENHDILEDPRLKIIIDDARNRLLKSEQLYDVISTDPILPYASGSGSLFTKEYFSLCKRRLRKDGVVALWFGLYFSPRDIKMVVRTFAEVFPYASLWYYGTEMILIGSPSHLSLDYAELERRLSNPKIRTDLEAIRIFKPEDLLRFFLAEREALLRYADGVPMHTDDRPRLELSAPKALARGELDPEVGKELRPLRRMPKVRNLPPGALDRFFVSKR